ncbi:DMT family transporter [Aestuariivirga litoralis]|uniref:DMT family transporter n=1 Tax=Aestuariivirga litoralis TaxID=2650924 RepID=UPI0018C623AC|nr:DMT family transporter [Aestuariivirga litoralis]MBG1232156.1 DMT family transporter [Aestuariivirga litoralis]
MTPKTKGTALVVSSALLWSIGGTIARFLSVTDSWTIVFWRSLFAALFLLIFMLVNDGPKETAAMFRRMGWAGWAVAVCFAIASTSFVVAMGYTTIANILLIQAGVPLIAALLAWIFFREKVTTPTMLAIAAVIAGVGVMVSESFNGKVSPIGDGLAVVIAVVFAIATVISRHHSEVRMMPAVCLATTIAALFASTQLASFAVSKTDFGLLILFGAVNLGAGLAVFTMGVRLIPAAFAALLGTLEPALGPIWVWLVHGEVPSSRTIIGGAVVFVALFIHLFLEWRRQPEDHSEQVFTV